MNTEVILYSGGQDSLVTLAGVRKAFPKSRILLFYCCLGNKSEDAEYLASLMAADHYKATFCPCGIKAPFLKKHSMEIPEVLQYLHVKQSKSKRTGSRPYIIPYRNFLLVSFALMFAAAAKAKRLWMGFDHTGCLGDTADKSPAFVNDFERLIVSGTESKEERILLMTPLQGMYKRQITALGLKLGVPFEKSWTCYNAFEKSCGICPTCVTRRRSFFTCGATDPLPYMTHKDFKKQCGRKVYRELCQNSYAFKERWVQREMGA